MLFSLKKKDNCCGVEIIEVKEEEKCCEGKGQDDKKEPCS